MVLSTSTTLYPEGNCGWGKLMGAGSVNWIGVIPVVEGDGVTLVFTWTLVLILVGGAKVGSGTFCCFLTPLEIQ